MNDNNSFRFQIGFLVSILVGLIILMIVIAPLKNSESNPDKCSEIKKLMLDDPEHSRLHSDYPNVLNDLHVYLSDNCNTDDTEMDSDKQ